MSAAQAGAPLRGPLTFKTAPPALDELAARLERGGALTVDLQAVDYVDSAGLALLLELTRRAKSEGATLRLTGASEQLRRLTKFFGIDALLPFAA